MPVTLVRYLAREVGLYTGIGYLAAFPIILILHTVGLAFLVGANVALDARMLGVARGVPLSAMLPFFVFRATSRFRRFAKGSPARLRMN